MAKKVTRQQEEAQSLQKFIENNGEKFNPDLIVCPPQDHPCDVRYKGENYQITYGDQRLIGEIRKKMSKREIYCGIRNVSDDNTKYATEFIGNALKNKSHQSSDDITLLIHCCFSGIYDPDKSERNKIFQDYIQHNKNLIGTWKNIYIIFPDCNIKLY